MEKMWSDLLLQAALILVVVFMFLLMHDIPKKFFSKLRFRGRADLQAKRHFVAGAQLLAQARSSKTSRSSATSLAKQAEAEADKAIYLDPKDAAAHILKALALDLQGFKASALESLDLALTRPAVRSLSEREKGDALFKRAEVRMSMSRRGQVESAIEDLNEAVKINSENIRAFCLLGDCYEVKKMREKAKTAYESALKIDPKFAAAQAALERLESVDEIASVQMNYMVLSQELFLIASSVRWSDSLISLLPNIFAVENFINMAMYCVFCAIRTIWG